MSSTEETYTKKFQSLAIRYPTEYEGLAIDILVLTWPDSMGLIMVVLGSSSLC